MTNTHMTYVDALTIAIDALKETNAEAAEKLTALKEQTIKRNAAKSDKPTKTQTANVGVKGIILNTLKTLGKAVTVTELQDAETALGELSNQKVSALVRQLVEEGKVVKTVEKRKSYFALGSVEEE